jgi:hypothetical protein
MRLLNDLWTIANLIAIAGVLGGAITGLVAMVRGQRSNIPASGKRARGWFGRRPK